jgi:signal transduction histidine kinase
MVQTPTRRTTWAGSVLPGESPAVGPSLWFEKRMRPRLIDAFVAAGRGLAATALAVAGIPLFALMVVCLALVPAGIGLVLFPGALGAVRLLAGEQRRLAHDWFGVAIAVPYRVSDEPAGRTSLRRTLGRSLGDPATWRELAWLPLGAVAGILLGVLPAVLLVYGLEGLTVGMPLSLAVDGYGYGAFWPASGFLATAAVVPQALLMIWLAVRFGPAILATLGRFHALFLAPTRQAALNRRVRHLAQTREQTVDAQAAELRRIERDLHDGAQARLVALSMSLGLAAEVFEREPASARRLISEARVTSTQAQAELRSLVRGIHPPVLAERGLGGAVQALALTLPLPVDVDDRISGRADAPVESAVYFATAEALANVVKHSRATETSVELHHDGDRFSVVVRDNGIGGADPASGTGLAGVDRRLAAFDGTLTVVSPAAGPTVVRIDVPCALREPRKLSQLEF